MKKFLLFIVIVASSISLSSCGDDDSPDKDQDLIVGKWKLYQLEIGGVLLPVDNLECEAQGVMEFMSDGIMTAEEFVENTEGECVLDEMIDGTWINKGSNIYEITIDGETSLEEVTFENDTFSFDEEEGDITMRIIFKRV